MNVGIFQVKTPLNTNKGKTLKIERFSLTLLQYRFKVIRLWPKEGPVLLSWYNFVNWVTNQSVLSSLTTLTHIQYIDVVC